MHTHTPEKRRREESAFDQADPGPTSSRVEVEQQSGLIQCVSMIIVQSREFAEGTNSSVAVLPALYLLFFVSSLIFTRFCMSPRCSPANSTVTRLTQRKIQHIFFSAFLIFCEIVLCGSASNYWWNRSGSVNQWVCVKYNPSLSHLLISCPGPVVADVPVATTTSYRWKVVDLLVSSWYLGWVLLSSRPSSGWAASTTI